MPQTLALTEDEALELLAFLVSAARTQVEEPPHYGIMRLLTAAERLSQFAKDRVAPDARKILEIVLDESPAMRHRLSDPKDYVGQLDCLCGTVAQYLAKRSGMSERAL